MAYKLPAWPQSLDLKTGAGQRWMYEMWEYIKQLSAGTVGDPTLVAFAAFNSNGLLTQTAADTFTSRTITGTAGTITVTNGNGVAGNPTLTIAATYVGQASITTLGTITTGVWNGTKISEVYGGTNQTTYALGDTLYSSAANTLAKLSGNTTTTKKFLRQTGDGINSAAPAWDTIASGDLTGLVVSSLTGTANRITVSAATGAVTLSTPQDIATGSSPQFAGLTLTGDLSVQGNTTIGDASGDTLTINAGTWTIGNNYVATRAVGTAAAGGTFFIEHDITFVGNGAGNTSGTGFNYTNTISGANAASVLNCLRYLATHSGTATLGTLTGAIGVLNVSSTGNATLARAYVGNLQWTNTGSSTNGVYFDVNTPSFTSTGTATSLIGLRIPNIGHANVTNAVGIKISDFTNAVTSMYGLQSSISSGTGKANLYIDGTAINYLAGNLQIGSTTATAGAEPLQVNGAISINSATMIRTYTSFTNGAGASAGTLGNAPAAGNPTKWIPINDNGTTRYIPAW